MDTMWTLIQAGAHQWCLLWEAIYIFKLPGRRMPNHHAWLWSQDQVASKRDALLSWMADCWLFVWMNHPCEHGVWGTCGPNGASTWWLCLVFAHLFLSILGFIYVYICNQSGLNIGFGCTHVFYFFKYNIHTIFGGLNYYPRTYLEL